MFDIPVALFLFKRIDTIKQIISVLQIVKPTKLYLLSDEGRNEEEKEMVHKTRLFVEDNITWPCTVIKRYFTENQGVYNNIGGGAKFVFEQEEKAIFLEDDNLPEVTFFEFCKENLEKYDGENKVLWICGTNYLEDYSPQGGSSYMFTQNLLPCGWASWSKKFLKYYDFELNTFNKKNSKIVRKRMKNKALFFQTNLEAKIEKDRFKNTGKFFSWDYHMAWSLRVHDMVGISPTKNQIKNIGVDLYAEHGGTSLEDEMTRRFCGMGSQPLSFPLKHPATITIDIKYENKVDKIVLLPFKNRVRAHISVFLHWLFRIPPSKSLTKKEKK